MFLRMNIDGTIRASIHAWGELYIDRKCMAKFTVFGAAIVSRS